MRQEYLVLGDLKDIQRIYYSMEDAETQHPECLQTEDHLGAGGGMTYRQSSSIRVPSGVSRGIHPGGCMVVC